MISLMRYMAFGLALLQLQGAAASNFRNPASNLTPEPFYQSVPAAKDPVAELIENPYQKYFTKADIERISQEIRAEEHRKQRLIKGQLIMVDTRDQEACQKIQDQLTGNRNMKAVNDVRGLCVQDNTKPIASVMVLRESNEIEWQREVDISGLTLDQSNLYTSTRNVALGAVGVAGLLYMMPESVTNWDKEKMKNLGKNWQENVKDGPVVDKDDWAINYIGHPYSGAIYYQVARHAGVGPMGSFGYSVLMSTFFWEYGVEAFAEKPSIQDLFITPIIGSIMGELFYRAELKIQKNGGKVWGSKKLGSVLIVLMNPMGAFSDQMNKLFGSKVIKSASARWVVRRHTGVGGHPSVERAPVWGFELQFKF